MSLRGPVLTPTVRREAPSLMGWDRMASANASFWRMVETLLVRQVSVPIYEKNR